MTEAAAIPTVTPLPWTARVRVAAGDIKLAHSVFALPFAILAAFLARSSSWPVFAGQVALVVWCMVWARTWAMLVNRWVDRDIDAKNPRTARRAVASGRLRVRDAVTLSLASAALFALGCLGYLVFFANPWPIILAAPVLLWIGAYSLTKRFTALCHIVLGSALAASPLAAALAVDPASIERVPAVAWLSGMVLMWVAGFDVIYALQDLDFDRATGLSSIPARLGVRGAVWTSRALHAGALACLVCAARSDERFGVLFFSAVGAVGLLLVIEHTIVARRGQAGLDMAFFTVNGIVSCVLGVAGVVDTL